MVDLDQNMCEAEEWTVVDGPVFMHWASHIDVKLKDYCNRSQWITAFCWDKVFWAGLKLIILSLTKRLVVCKQELCISPYIAYIWYSLQSTGYENLDASCNFLWIQ